MQKQEIGHKTNFLFFFVPFFRLLFEMHLTKTQFYMFYKSTFIVKERLNNHYDLICLFVSCWVNNFR